MRTTGIILPIFSSGLNHIGKMFLSKEYRCFNALVTKINDKKRYTQGTVKIDSMEISYVDSASLISSYKDIFFRQIYRFKAINHEPFIIDCGANVGLVELYFNRLYPAAKIIAFEPDRKIFQCLNKNIRENKLSNVIAENKAVWHSRMEMDFSPDNADGGRLIESPDKSSKKVETVVLEDYCDRKVDFLKVDIEGAEWEVLSHSKRCLKNIENLFVEYHSTVNSQQLLPELLALLKDAGFRLNIQSRSSSVFKPFIETAPYCGFDMHLDIFCTKPE